MTSPAEYARLSPGESQTEIFHALCALLPHMTAQDMLRSAPVLTKAVPELGPMVGFDQKSPHHAYDLYTHVAHVVEAVPQDLAVRWAALLHDIGKVPTFTQDATGRGHFYGHAGIGAEMADAILRRMAAPKPLRQQVVLLIDRHMTRIPPETESLRQWISQLGEDTLLRLLALQEADMNSKGIPKEQNHQQFLELRQLAASLRNDPSPNRS